MDKLDKNELKTVRAVLFTHIMNYKIPSNGGDLFIEHLQYDIDIYNKLADCDVLNVDEVLKMLKQA